MRFTDSRPSGIVALALAGLIVAASAGAQQATAPAPGGAGVAVTDPTGDAQRVSGTDGGANFDITGMFFKYEGGKLMAHMQLAEGGSELPPGATGARWYMFWKFKDQERWVRAAINNLGEPVFNFGHTEESPTGGSTYTTDGDTTGKFFTGPNGVLQIVVPAAVGGASGSQLTDTAANTFEAVNNPVQNQLFDIDRAPDADAFGSPYTTNLCEAGAAPPPAPPPAAPPPPSIALPEQPTTPGALQVKVLTKSAKPKGSRVALKLSSPGTVTAIEAALFKGKLSKPRVLARGKLAKLARKGTLKLKLARKLKKGRYGLQLVGTNPDGKRANLTTKVRIK